MRVVGLIWLVLSVGRGRASDSVGGGFVCYGDTLYDRMFSDNAGVTAYSCGELLNGQILDSTGEPVQYTCESENFAQYEIAVFCCQTCKFGWTEYPFHTQNGRRCFGKEKRLPSFFREFLARTN